MFTTNNEKGRVMKRLVVLFVICLMTSQAFASLKFSGSGSDRQINTGSFPPQMKANYELMSSKCTKCHSLERLVISLKTGIAPISNQPFNLEHMQTDINSMVRRSNARKFPISKEESQSIFAVLKYMLEESAH